MRFRIHKKGYKQLGKVSKGLVNERSTHEKKREMGSSADSQCRKVVSLKVVGTKHC